MKLRNIAFRNIKRNKKRSILSIISTAIATFAIVFMFSLVEGMEMDMKDMSYNYDTGQIQIRNKKVDEKVFSLDRAVDNYREVVALIENELPYFEISPRLKFPSQVIKNDKIFTCFGVGVEFDREVEFLKLKDKILEGRIPESGREVLMGIGLAQELELKIGDKFTPITMTRKEASSGITFKVVGLAKFSNAGFTNKTFLAPLTDLPKMLKMDGAVSEVLFKNSLNDEWDSTKQHINRILDQNGYNQIEALTWTEVGLAYSMLQMADVSYNIMALFFFGLASTVIANTMLMVVFERKKEIGTITAMGMAEKEVIRLFFLEAFILGVLGAALGVVLGIGLVIPLSYVGMDMSSLTEDVDFGMSFLIYPQVTIKSTIYVFLFSVFIASFISYFPSKSAAKVDPVVALRG